MCIHTWKIFSSRGTIRTRRSSRFSRRAHACMHASNFLAPPWRRLLAQLPQRVGALSLPSGTPSPRTLFDRAYDYILHPPSFIPDPPVGPPNSSETTRNYTANNSNEYSAGPRISTATESLYYIGVYRIV